MNQIDAITIGIKKLSDTSFSCTYESHNVCRLELHNDYIKPEVIAHEYTHGIAHYRQQGPFDSEGESGALEESLGDVFGIAFKHWLDPNQRRNWSIANLRNLTASVTTETYNSESDIHDQGLIPGHAFYLAVKYHREKETWGLVSKIWFRAFMESPRNEDFKGFAKRTFTIAHKILQVNVDKTNELYAKCSRQNDFLDSDYKSFNKFVEENYNLPDVNCYADAWKAIYQAWSDVGINLLPPITSPSPASQRTDRK
jgi:Zn-dependent metalloprotease